MLRNRNYFSLTLLFGIVLILCGCSLFVQAQTTSLVWSPNLPFNLTSYDTYVQSSDLWHFSSFTINDDNLVFYNSYIGTGTTAIPTFYVQSINANITFSKLSITGTTTFTVEADSSAVITLTGFSRAPQNISFNGLAPTGLQYSYLSGNDTLLLLPSAGSTDIVLSNSIINPSFMTNLFGMSLSALALFAMVPLVSAGCVIIGMLLMARQGRPLEEREVLITIVIVVIVDITIMLAIAILSVMQTSTASMFLLSLFK